MNVPSALLSTYLSTAILPVYLTGLPSLYGFFHLTKKDNLLGLMMMRMIMMAEISLWRKKTDITFTTYQLDQNGFIEEA